MATARGIRPVPYFIFYPLLILELLTGRAFSSDLACPQNCTCTIDTTDCSQQRFMHIPQDLPDRTVYLNLSHNQLTTVNMDVLSNLPNLREVRLDHNELTSIPAFGSAASAIVTLHLFLGGNKIVYLEFGTFRNLAGTLQVLRLGRNRLTQLPVKGLELPKLTHLELSRNRLRLIEGLTFQGLSSLEVLKLQRNNISKLTDGAFWGLARMRSLHLDFNSLKEVNSGSLYGLESLLHLHLSNNSISSFNPEGWGFCEKLRELHLAQNNLTKLSEGSFAKLVNLQSLRLSHNSISYIAEGAFRGLGSLRLLELDHNDISGTIEDTSGAFTGLENLRKLTLFENRIKSVAKRAFSGLEALEHLNLGGNAIRSVLPDAFSKMKNLRSLEIASDSFLCDCQLHWFPEWLKTRDLQAGVRATCAHPESLKGTSIFQAPPQSFVCEDLPKPQITVHPVPTAAVLGKDVRLTCTAASSSSSPMSFTWRKDQELLSHAHVENFAHAGSHEGGGIMEYTTVLHLRSVAFEDEGRYQCVISNHFGSTYSSKARLSISVLPSFVKTPRDLTIRARAKARLECAAKGYPPPQVAWQKDGGTDFPAARERRMQVMPDDDVFFIMDVKPEDMGVYSCTAKNTAGMISANVTLTVLETPYLAQAMEDRSVAVGEAAALQCKAVGSPAPRITWLHGDQPLLPSERHHFTHSNQLLVISSAAPEDAGRYTCVMSNPLGTERAQSILTVYQRDAASCHAQASTGAVTAGIVVIAVVTSVVVTSLVWVCIIYQTRKKSEECSVNTDETIIPPDVPSYLSSQGTLSDRQDVCLRVESSGGSQPNGHLHANGGFDVPVVCTDYMETGSNVYARPPDYFHQTRAPPSGQEYHQIQQPSSFTSQKTSDGHCNGTPNGVRRDPTLMPNNRQSDREDSTDSRAGTPATSQEDESHRHPLKPPSDFSTRTDSDLTRTLLPNGHTHPGESAPLRQESA
ncbi:leucine-rich repeats and immunoglobulin-like domains protein 1 isoform X2 [Trichomycterus rosablanca]|uniref:leucine-rich repeats and immunoglobulin-like domains protein 1 isoform X2 n=1 Tax=Trichomycterus rosablanca TaxID=2290929 RepID=UPI002F35540D